MKQSTSVLFTILAITLSACSNNPTVSQGRSSNTNNAENSSQMEAQFTGQPEPTFLDVECMTTQPGPQKQACIDSACKTAQQGSLLRQKCDAGIYKGEEKIARGYGENFPDCALAQNADELEQCLSEFCKTAISDSPEKKTCDAGLYKQYFKAK